jgi:rRNA-processing protein FCF1
MTLRNGKVIIDTNLLMNALDFRKCDVFNWIDEVYEEIYINIEVLNEFRVESERDAILAQTKNRNCQIV